MEVTGAVRARTRTERSIAGSMKRVDGRVACALDKKKKNQDIKMAGDAARLAITGYMDRCRGTGLAVPNAVKSSLPVSEDALNIE